jgi:outer membrane biosynthesis protein TonB
MTSTNQSFLYSVFLHGFIILIMFLVKFHYSPPPISHYIEILAIERIEIPREPVVSPPSAPASQGQPATNQPIETLPTQIDIPEVTFPDFDPVDISNLPQRADRITRSHLTDTRTMVDEHLHANLERMTMIDHQTTSGMGQSSVGTGMNLDGLAGEIRNQTGSLSQYRLDGDVVNRTIIRRVIPDFPENVLRNGTVTIQFVVLENGSVANPTIIRMDQTEFANISMAAIRQWVFNTADRTHTGQITFNFLLE